MRSERRDDHARIVFTFGSGKGGPDEVVFPVDLGQEFRGAPGDRVAVVMTANGRKRRAVQNLTTGQRVLARKRPLGCAWGCVMLLLLAASLFSWLWLAAEH